MPLLADIVLSNEAGALVGTLVACLWAWSARAIQERVRVEHRLAERLQGENNSLRRENAGLYESLLCCREALAAAKQSPPGAEARP